MRNTALLAPAVALALLGASGPASAQNASDEAATANEATEDALRRIAQTGRQMYLYDQAAWHGTDSFRAAWGDRSIEGLRGYIVVPGEGRQLYTLFFGEGEGGLAEFARIAVEGSTIASSIVHPADARPALSDLAKRMASARQTAIEELVKRQLGLCSNTPPNTIVLPPGPDGRITVYVLTSTTESDSYPMGGHYRFEVSAEGAITADRKFMNTCFPLGFGANGEGQRPEAAVLTHLLDPNPTEVHVFASHYIPVPLLVVTVGNSRMWGIERGRISDLGHVPES